MNLIKISSRTFWLCATCSTFSVFGLSIVHFEPVAEFELHPASLHPQHPDLANQVESTGNNLTRRMTELEELRAEFYRVQGRPQEPEDTESDDD